MKDTNINLDDSKIIKIYNARDDIEATLIIDALEKENIFCNTLEAGSGDWMKVTQGFSVYGIDIYVLEENADLAKCIIEQVLSGIENESEEELEKEELISIPWYRNKKLLVRGYLIATVIIVAFMILYVVFTTM